MDYYCQTTKHEHFILGVDVTIKKKHFNLMIMLGFATICISCDADDLYK